MYEFFCLELGSTKEQILYVTHIIHSFLSLCYQTVNDITALEYLFVLKHFKTHFIYSHLPSKIMTHYI